MVLENRLDNIFTSYDESIFSDGSIDPMGLRIIWTSLGNKILANFAIKFTEYRMIINKKDISTR